jgi:2-keto-4-pentenoate hydratase/2-oxohepta-3-ene-1,7-dioic acid hydratase in catechol pathway
VDYEAELGVVIKRRTKDIDPSEALEYILGYTCVNDVTARDLQKRDGQWTRAKSFDSFCPIGPCIETDIDPSDCRVESFLNGKIKQSSSTGNQIFPPFFLVSFISRIMTLLPGDVIATGTPSGVGSMNIGDEIEVFIEGIGRLKNYVI